jgi:hypothetical protein
MLPFDTAAPDTHIDLEVCGQLDLTQPVRSSRQNYSLQPRRARGFLAPQA